MGILVEHHLFFFFYFYTLEEVYFFHPNTWFSGIVLLFLLMAIAFMGYVLPFGQMSFWGATVITNLLSIFPSLIEWICGGYSVHSPTLKRFFIFYFFKRFLWSCSNSLPIFSSMSFWSFYFVSSR